eukprot:INCI3617.4.p1 GENE.INCI3617.4~~INCI3617.4.p1  ORF type:complete len:403 (-),score=68.04 INCI3617.4:99-1307(-)
MGNSESNEVPDPSVRGRLGVEEYRGLQHAIRHHLLPPAVAKKRLTPETRIPKDRFCHFFSLSYAPDFAGNFFEYVASHDGRSDASLSAVSCKALVAAVGILCKAPVKMRSTAMFKLFSHGSDKMDRAKASQFLSCLLTTYLLLGSHDFRSGGGATAPVPDCDQPKQEEKGSVEVLPTPGESDFCGDPELPEADGASASNEGEREKTEREKEREELTLLGKAGDMDEYTVAQQFRDQQEAAKARAAASTIRVDAMESADVSSTFASEVTHFVEGFNKDWTAEPQLSLATFQEWVSTSSISLPNVMRSVLYQMCLIPAEAEVAYPRHLILRPKVFAQSHLLRPADILALSLVSAGMQDDWSLAYSSARDGLSFNRLTNGIMGYDGPTLFVIRNEAGEIFGAFAR